MTESLQILILALTMWHEGRGEGQNGIRLIADTIYNRALSQDPKEGQMKQTLTAVVLAPEQYECWSIRDPKAADVPVQVSEEDRKAWQYCVALARLMLRERYEPATTATHYWRAGMELKAWQYDMEVVVEVGNHVFAKAVSNKTTKEQEA